MILPKEFYEEDAITVAKKLLGKVLVRKVDGKVIKCKIVETESYIGDIDKASHAYNGRRTERTEPLFHSGGISYVYFIYGLYHCFNVISDKEDVASGVLIRAVIRLKKKYDKLSKTQKKSLTNGPAKLCMALNITKKENYHRLYEESTLYIEEGNKEEIDIVETTRIGIDYAEEAINFPWRFYIKNNVYVSKK